MPIVPVELVPAGELTQAARVTLPRHVRSLTILMITPMPLIYQRGRGKVAARRHTDRPAFNREVLLWYSAPVQKTGAACAALLTSFTVTCACAAFRTEQDAGLDAGPDQGSPDAGDGGADAGLDAGPPSPYGQGCSSMQDAIGLVLRKGATSKLPRQYYTYVPTSYDPSIPIPLVISLHGDGDNAEHFMTALWEADADQKGFMVLVPEGSAQVLAGPPPGYTFETTDTTLINGAIDDVQRCYNTDLHHQILHGFSAGGELAYIMGLGPDDNRFSGLAIASSDLGSAIILAERSKLPSLLPSEWLIPASLFHGTQDPNFPFAQCGEGSRDALVDAGHAVDFHSFNGGHETSPADALQQYEDLESSTSP